MSPVAAHTSIFDLFKIGLGPSSSHTMGPMRAGAMFARELTSSAEAHNLARVVVDLYGSLALTGIGHATDRAVLLGLEGHEPQSIDPEFAERRVAEIRVANALRVGGTLEIGFDEMADVRWRKSEMLSHHSNGMRFTALDAHEHPILVRTYYSVGGGFVEEEGVKANTQAQAIYPHPFDSARQLLEIAERAGATIGEIVLANETAQRSASDVNAYIDRIWEVMRACVERGLLTEGILPGGLQVRRRAPRLHRRFVEKPHVDGLEAMEYVNIAAMAVNEENAAGGRVVTAPTNGAAGVIPAVLHYYVRYCSGDRDGIVRFLLTATAIGSLYKNNASISGAEVGCQGEVGVACSMAAGGLVAALGGKNAEMEHAAEIGMEHSLGMTCDPIGGLVQVPCIERNAVGAVRAIHAARMAMEDDGEHLVSLDKVIEVMYRTGMDMQRAYKETSLGGLAVGVVEC
jgi:L-serine dehydratase